MAIIDKPTTTESTASTSTNPTKKNTMTKDNKSTQAYNTDATPSNALRQEAAPRQAASSTGAQQNPQFQPQGNAPLPGQQYPGMPPQAPAGFIPVGVYEELQRLQATVSAMTASLQGRFMSQMPQMPAMPPSYLGMGGQPAMFTQPQMPPHMYNPQGFGGQPSMGYAPQMPQGNAPMFTGQQGAFGSGAGEEGLRQATVSYVQGDPAYKTAIYVSGSGLVMFQGADIPGVCRVTAKIDVPEFLSPKAGKNIKGLQHYACVVTEKATVLVLPYMSQQCYPPSWEALRGVITQTILPSSAPLTTEQVRVFIWAEMPEIAVAIEVSDRSAAKSQHSQDVAKELFEQQRKLAQNNKVKFAAVINGF